MKRITLTIATILLATVAFAQEWKDVWTDYHWTDGGEMLSSVRLNKSQVLLVANGYTDAGYGYLLEVESLGGTNHNMKSIPESQVKERPQYLDELAAQMLDNESCNGTLDNIWKRREIGGHDVILRYSSDNVLRTVYLPTGREMSEVANDDMQEILSGTYTSTTGKKFQFNIDGTCIFDGRQTTYYMADEGEYGMPDYYITAERQIWEMELTAEGMNIYKVFHRADVDGPQRGKLYATLKASKKSPRWPFLSDRICASYALEIRDKELLRIMRNEIYARHGYRFSDKKLQTYFASCPWYKPAKDNSLVKLTDVESLNVELIRRWE